MSLLISKIGRSSFKTRALYAVIYTILIAGSLTMLYPFLLMISGSTKSAVDISSFDIIPGYFRDDLLLYRKHIEGVFNESPKTMSQAYGVTPADFKKLTPPADYNFQFTDEYRIFLKNGKLPWYSYSCGYIDTPVSRTLPLNLRKLKNEFNMKWHGDISALNRELSTEFHSWNSIRIRPKRYLLRRERPSSSPYSEELYSFYSTVSPGLRYYFSLPGFYRESYIKAQYGRSIDEYNRTHKTRFKSSREIELHRSYPSSAPRAVRDDWENFVRYTLGSQWIRADSSAEPDYQAFLRKKYKSIKELNRYYRSGYRDFGDIRVADRERHTNIANADWDFFLSGGKGTNKSPMAPIKSLHIVCPDFYFQDYLKNKYQSTERLNEILGTSFADFKEIEMPQAALHYAYFLRHRSEIRREFTIRNYIAVLDYIMLHGRGIINTVVYCILAILSALIVNPLAAYALSRYRLPSAYKILLFLLCTMAFPPMVTSIPNFLILRKAGLLNTFAALVLPAMANGYAIFLLKGFFDSQPRELYESAQLDGAGEWTLFWQIAMSLSKPILAVIALQAFTLAYSNFMFAFVVCQDEKMWTLMVWLYQLSQRCGQSVMYASLIIAAIPTFIVFILCQKVIIRGIVVPSEK